MIRSSKPKFSRLTALLIIVAGGLWLYNEFQTRPSGKSAPSTTLAPHQRSTPPRPSPPTPSSEATEEVGNYQVYRSCTLVDARSNDGDSFSVRLPDGKVVELRLYFVDTPESAFKNYGGGETNHPRIRQQAAEMGGITPDQAVEIGQKSKKFTLLLLGSRPFDIFTLWDSPFKDNRFHAFIEVQQDGKSRWLSELLIEHGLARIKTKPADLPDGTPASQQTAHLRELERAAKRAEMGVWGL